MPRPCPVLLLLLLAACAVAQHPRKPADRAVRIGAEGVLRWQDDGDEVTLFGVNYYPPCSIDYANLKLLGISHKETIDRDLQHLQRMGLDALRLHVFDREVSDEQGNLLDNDHVDLLDYLIAEAKKRGIYTVLTPMAWWGVPGESRGFSNLYDKAQMHTDPAAVAAQCNYLKQFLTHKNRYTGLTYGEDPATPVLEIINEPIPADGTPDDVIVGYINALYDAIRETGCTKPVFYNGWGGRLGAVGRAKVEGCTFGWYPSGLCSGGVLTGNFLPRVADYPEMRDVALRSKGKVVYEFDAADIPGGYVYPAMARSFRSGGAQIATQFQYDPLPLADTNTNWNTHFLNLVYAPHRAVSFAIAAEAFHRLPRLERYGDYPTSNRFGPFRVSYEEQLSEMVTDETFIYSNSTETRPPAPGELTRIVGCGSSPVVQYEGTGAYFLDRLSDGVWRLEVYPDCVWVADPFGATNLGREASRVYWRERAMGISLPDLGPTFRASGLGDTRGGAEAEDGVVALRPGLYLLRRPGAPEPLMWIDPTFHAPPQRDLPPAVWHVPVKALMEGQPLKVRASVAAAADPDSVRLELRAPEGSPGRSLPMRQLRAYEFGAEVPAASVTKGTLTYCITVDAQGQRLTFPSPIQGSAAERFVTRDPVTLLQFTGDEPLPAVSFGGAPGQTAKAEWAAGATANRKALQVSATGFGPPPSAAGVRLSPQVSGEALRGYNTLVIRARSTTPDTSHLEIGLVGAAGNTAAYGCDVPLSPAFRDFRIPLARCRTLWQTQGGLARADDIRQLSFAFGSWLFPEAADQPHAVEIEKVSLEYEPEAFSVPVYAPADPFVIFAPTAPLPGIISELPWRQWITAGSRPEVTAWHLEVARFGPAPSCLGARADVGDLSAIRRPAAAEYDTLHVRARATEEATTAVEIVLVESDGAPWGATPKLTTEWQDIRVPLSELRFFGHWFHPEGRGGEGDRLRPGDLASVHLTFGAWLYPDTFAQRHGFEIESIALTGSHHLPEVR